MRRSIHFVKSGNLECTGILQIVAGLAQYSSEYGYQTQVLFLGDGPLISRAESSGIETSTIAWNGTIFDLKGAICVWFWLLRHPADVLHLHWGGRLLRALCRLTRSKVVIRHLHGRIDESTGVVSSSIRLQWLDGAIACSQSVADCVASGKVEIITSGMDTECSREGRRSGSCPLTIGVLSRLIPAKNIEAAIEAVAILIQRGMDTRLEIAGSGPSEGELRALVARLQLEERVNFLGWRTDVKQLLSTWDLLAMPSTDEGFPIAALQAMAAGRPVVASGAGGLVELVEDGVTGKIIPTGNARALADCIEGLAHDRSLLEEMGRACQRRVRERFSVAQMAQRTFEFYDRLLEQR